MNPSRLRYWNLFGGLLTAFTLVFALLWAFPIYWAIATSLKPEGDVVEAIVQLIPRTTTLSSYVYVFVHSSLATWYLNSLITSVAVTAIVVFLGAACGYAISQLEFTGRKLLYGVIIASFMVPIQALIVNHFVLISQFGLINTLTGVILPQLISPVVVIVYKRFFDAIPKDFREAAVLDGAGDVKIFTRIYLPMNWGITTALAIITFISAWDNFLWPFLAISAEDRMNVTVGITQVHEAFGIAYARNMSSAVLAALPVAIVYLIFQRRVTQAIALSAGIKG